MMRRGTSFMHTAQLKGIVEVTQPLRDTNTADRIRIANLCKDAILTLQGLRKNGNTPPTDGVTGVVIFRGNQTVRVEIDPTQFKVFQEKNLVTKQMLQDVSTIIAIRDTNGVLVVMGKCQKNHLRVAVVLKLESLQKADLVISDYTQAMTKRNKRMSVCVPDILNSMDAGGQRMWTPFSDIPNTNKRTNTPIGVVRPLNPPAPPPRAYRLPITANPVELKTTDHPVNCLSTAVASVVTSAPLDSQLETSLHSDCNIFADDINPPPDSKTLEAYNPYCVETGLQTSSSYLHTFDSSYSSEPFDKVSDHLNIIQPVKGYSSNIKQPKSSKIITRPKTKPPDPPKTSRPCTHPLADSQSNSTYINNLTSPLQVPSEDFKLHEATNDDPVKRLSTTAADLAPLIQQSAPLNSQLDFTQQNVSKLTGNIPNPSTSLKPFIKTIKTFKTCDSDTQVTDPHPSSEYPYTIDSPKCIESSTKSFDNLNINQPTRLAPCPLDTTKLAVKLRKPPPRIIRPWTKPTDFPNSPRLSLPTPDNLQINPNFSDKPNLSLLSSPKDAKLAAMTFNSEIGSGRPSLPPRRPFHQILKRQISDVPASGSTEFRVMNLSTSNTTSFPPSPIGIPTALAMGSASANRYAPPLRPPSNLKPKPLLGNSANPFKYEVPQPPTSKRIASNTNKKPILPPKTSREALLNKTSNTHQNSIYEVPETPTRRLSFETLRVPLSVMKISTDSQRCEVNRNFQDRKPQPPVRSPVQFSESKASHKRFSSPDLFKWFQAGSLKEETPMNTASAGGIKPDAVRHNSTSSESSAHGQVTSRLSISSVNSWSEDQESPCQEGYYTSLGINVEDSESVYMEKTMRQSRERLKSSESLAEQINSFVLEDRKYIEKLENIIKVSEDMAPQLQTHLRRLHPLCEVHRDIHDAILNCADSCSAISDVLVSYKEKLEPYIYYIMKATEVNNLLKDIPEAILASYPYIKDEIRSSWKKFNFYLLHLEMFLKNAPDEGKASITQAIGIMRDLNRRADTEILLEGVKGAPYPLHSLGSLLLHSNVKVSGPLLKKGCNVRALLFPSTVVITECKTEMYDFLLGIPVRQSFFGPVNQDNPNTFILEVNYGKVEGKRRYTFQARSKQVRDSWVAEISRLMLHYAEQEKFVETKRTGTLV